MYSVKEALTKATQQIKGISDIPNKEARILLASYLKKDQLWLITHDGEEIVEEGYFKLIERRFNNEPIEYITNSASFYGRDFYVDSNVLIPRPETEILVDEVISTCKGIKRPTIVEIGTGSGIISIVLALLIPDAIITAIDISKEALKVAQKNAEKYEVDDRIEFIHSDLCENYKKKNFDMLVSNPPYIANDESLHIGLSYEPSMALYGGKEGDEILKNIINIFIEKNVKNLACEMGYDQKDAITNYLKDFNLKANFYKDLARLDRGFVINK
ncbi:peptide chain release factor N(5)-glutamine methyltransferase [Sulfurospirillum arcachonense]|uniref:peptide chain release factor N(5)-glutamine methyltransferase n=1 Tax=Sulfurospirillum arcachonense TaxID=57666 RepID=UPI00046ABBE4|nr:peptide chain release factor N(5)-glutamine methyltransferase [Sulfurospirillum arcachonense]